MLEEKEPQYEPQDDEKIIEFSPKLINDPHCDHYYQDDYLDPEGRQHCQCLYCPMGRLYDLTQAELVKGKIISLEE